MASGDAVLFKTLQELEGSLSSCPSLQVWQKSWAGVRGLLKQQHTSSALQQLIIEDLTSTCLELQAKLEGIENKASDSVDRLAIQLQEAEREVSTLRAANAELTLSAGRAQQLQAELERTNVERQTLTLEIEKLTNLVSKVGEVDDLEKRLKMVSDDRDQWIQRNELLRRELESSRKQIDLIAKESNEFEVLLKKHDTPSSQSEVSNMKFVMTAMRMEIQLLQGTCEHYLQLVDVLHNLVAKAKAAGALDEEDDGPWLSSVERHVHHISQNETKLQELRKSSNHEVLR